MDFLQKKSGFFTRGPRVSPKHEDDLEKMTFAIDHVSDPWQSVFVQELFDLPADITSRYPGILAYCQRMKDGLEPLLGPPYLGTWSKIGHKCPRDVDGCWPRFTAVLKAIKDASRKDSIEEVWWRLIPPGEILGTQDKLGDAHGFLVVFAVVCWATAALRPVLPNPLESLTTINFTCQSKAATEDAPPPDAERCKDRPLRPFFSRYKEWAWGSPTSSVSTHEIEDENLYRSTLNLSSLSRFGKVRIEWTETISDHLKFDPVERNLFLFKFPSFCVLKAIRTSKKKKQTSLQRIAFEFDPLTPDEGEPPSRITMEQEILLSYRLLLGGDAGSRKLARKELHCLQRKDGCLDDLLHALCTQKYKPGSFSWFGHDSTLVDLPRCVWPPSCLNYDGELQESTIYSTQHDFPRFAKRLQYIQQFSLRQKPSRLTDLWRDRRNMVQWHTFWLVLIVGTVGLLLAFLQLLVSLVQLANDLKE